MAMPRTHADCLSQVPLARVRSLDFPARVVGVAVETEKGRGRELDECCRDGEGRRGRRSGKEETVADSEDWCKMNYDQEVDVCRFLDLM